jgi:hypothetical protein
VCVFGGVLGTPHDFAGPHLVLGWWSLGREVCWSLLVEFAFWKSSLPRALLWASIQASDRAWRVGLGFVSAGCWRPVRWRRPQLGDSAQAEHSAGGMGAGQGQKSQRGTGGLEETGVSC